MDAPAFDGKGGRRVSFSSKCQVIPSEEVEDDSTAVQEALARSGSDKDGKKRRSRLNVFRSLGSSSSARRWEEERLNSEKVYSSSTPAPKSTSQERRSRGLSPSLPINKNPTPAQKQAETLRRKLISPPPPLPSPSASPLLHRLSLTSATKDQDSDISNSPELPEGRGPDISKPLAVRKPLSLGPSVADDVDDAEPSLENDREIGAEKSTTLRVPEVVSIERESPSEEAPARAILKWKGEDEEQEEEEGVPGEELFEEDLNEECVCPDCEPKMTAALSRSYEPPWTRTARKKYLADKKQAQIEGSKKKSSGLPSWLRKDEEEEEESALTAREIKADEVDAKKGVSSVEVVPILTNSTTNGLGLKATDASLKDEVDQELRKRKEEDRVKRSRHETKRLSNDFASGLVTGGGGGARAMMRQLEEAERLEKRASIQRTKSPTLVAEAKKEESRPMGAVKDTIVRPFTSPRRLSDTSLPVLSPLPRTPSPQLQQPKKKIVSPSKEELIKSKDREHRHPSPSLLIRRELSLGIPIHANYQATHRSSWPAHPPTRTPSPRLISPTTLEDIAEVPSRTITERGGSGNSTPRRANTIGHSTHQQSISNRRFASATNGDPKVKRSNSLSGKPTNLSNSQGGGTGLGLNLSQHAQTGDATKAGQARHKTRIIFKDLVARIKS